MTRPSSKKYRAFEFDEDDKIIENTNNKFRCKAKNRKMKNSDRKTKSHRDSPINKYKFLQAFACGTKLGDQEYTCESIDVDAEVAQEPKTQQEHCTELLDIDASDKSCKSTNPLVHSKPRQVGDGPIKVETLHPRSTDISSSCKTELVGTISSESSSTQATSSASSTSSTAENQVPLEKQLFEPDSSECEIDEENMTVKIFPSLIFYQNVSLVSSTLTFSCNGIRLEGSTLNATSRTFCSEWAISDIMNIKSEWNALVNTAMVSLYLQSENSKGTGNANKLSGVEELKFTIYDPDWAKGQEAIRSLDLRYKDVWNLNFFSDMITGEKGLGKIGMFSPKWYVSGSDEPFEDVIYPKGDPDAVIISKRDIERLKPETFINDTIIDFYIKYLASKIEPKEKHRFHFFNSFFFRKLADLDKDPSSAYEGQVAFQRVRKWTRRVNLFDKDYIFIPVNYSLHWSLLIICYPGEVPNSKDEEYESTSKIPCILHMDSIRGSHKGLRNLIQRYLCEEWKDRHNGTVADASSKFLTLRFVPLELPQQENLFDCGLFLLHYVERFVEEVPLNFSPFNITKFSNFLSRNWFPPAEASLKRYLIKKLIYAIHEDHLQNAPTADSIDSYPSSVPDKAGDQDAEVIVLEEVGGPTKTCCGIACDFNAEQVGTSLPNSRGFTESGFSFELFESGACSRLYTSADYLQSPTTHQRNTISPIKEVEETLEQVPESPLDMGDFEQCRRADKENSVSGSSCGSPWLGVNVTQQLHKTQGFDHLTEPYKQEYSSSSWNEFSHLVVEDSEDEEDSVYDNDTNRDTPLTSIGNNLDLWKDWSTESIVLKGNNRSGSGTNPVLGLDEVCATKRPRLKRFDTRTTTN